eukprot:superscaffoldBa00001987_g12757
MSAMRVDAKVVMLGKESVGKTSLVERYVHHRFLVGPYQNVSVSCSASMPMSARCYLTDSSSFQRARFWVKELQNCEEVRELFLSKV